MKSLLIRRAACCLIAITLIMAISSCSNNESKNPSEPSDGTGQEQRVITLVTTPLEPNIAYAAIEYNNAHKDVYIKTTELKTDENFINKLVTGLSVGEGPDIIVIDPLLFPAVSKVAVSGIFYDLNELISVDKEFKLPDFNTKVLDYGVIDGKRYFIPITYDFPGFYAKKGELEKKGLITEGPQYNLRNFVDFACSYSENNNNNSKYFACTLSGLSCSDFVKISGIPIIDMNKKETRLSSPEFIDVLNMYKRFAGTICEIDYSEVSGSMVSISGYGTISKFRIPGFDSGNYLTVDNKSLMGWLKSDFNADTELYLYPSYYGESKISLQPAVSYGINVNCKYKEDAYDFIKQLISERYQGSTAREGTTVSISPKASNYIPVNNDAFLLDAAFSFGNVRIDGNMSDTERIARNKELFDDIKKYSKPDAKRTEWNRALLNKIEELGECDMIDPVVYEIIDEECKPFLEGKKTAEQTASVIEDKVRLYIYE